VIAQGLWLFCCLVDDLTVVTELTMNLEQEVTGDRREDRTEDQ